MFQKNETCTALEECYLMSHIPKRNLASSCHLLKKIDQTSWRTTRRNYKHIPQIVCISSRFRVLHLLSWEFERSEALWRHTDILVCHLKQVEVGWSIRNYLTSLFLQFLRRILLLPVVIKFGCNVRCNLKLQTADCELLWFAIFDNFSHVQTIRLFEPF